ncbi:uncharacterized protein TNCV_609441 [Trichonephila clavipes]|nr:uncharacterized protein TNCV_609441 [Trichonephila clavipes]
MTWERNRNHHELSDNTAEKNIRSLENQMTFLRQEVQGEEMVVLSGTGFASNQVTRKKEYVCAPLNEISGDPATAAALQRSNGLQTLCVIARGQDRERRIRILLDSTSQYPHCGRDYKLGNTVIGMQDDVCHIDRNVMTKLSIGFSVEKLTILPNGRYELQFPWKHDPVNLPDNKGLTWARHEKVIKRAESNGFLREYQKVFVDWENLGIIEIVPEEVKAVKCHYLAHRPVIKLQSETTKYRPCFDGSACENGKPALNQCLYKSINLVEVVPNIFNRFRLYPIGLSADIEKAFLMLSDHPQDRDYLRFFYPSKRELVYRHCRIVFFWFKFFPFPIKRIHKTSIR